MTYIRWIKDNHLQTQTQIHKKMTFLFVVIIVNFKENVCVFSFFENITKIKSHDWLKQTVLPQQNNGLILYKDNAEILVTRYGRVIYDSHAFIASDTFTIPTRAISGRSYLGKVRRLIANWHPDTNTSIGTQGRDRSKERSSVFANRRCAINAITNLRSGRIDGLIRLTKLRKSLMGILFSVKDNICSGYRGFSLYYNDVFSLKVFLLFPLWHNLHGSCFGTSFMIKAFIFCSFCLWIFFFYV